MEIREINQSETQDLIEKGSAVIVDVREKWEFDDFNIGGINIPAHLLNDHLNELKQYSQLIVACSNGTRSSIMARVIQKKLPKKEIYHLEEGVF